MDILHFCGHSFYEEKRKVDSGLLLEDGVLDPEKLRGVLAPRIAFMNSCESGQTGGKLAQFFVGSGTEVFIGTTWKVGDAAAATFADVFYRHIAIGDTVRTSIAKARSELFKKRNPDWANFVQYGDGDYSLV